MFYGMDSISNSNDELSGNRPQLEVETFEMVTRMQDMEFRVPRFRPPTTDDVPIPLLADDADLAQVIKVINELIKRDLTLKKVK